MICARKALTACREHDGSSLGSDLGWYIQAMPELCQDPEGLSCTKTPAASPLCRLNPFPQWDDLVAAARVVYSEGFFRKPLWGRGEKPGSWQGPPSPARPSGCCDEGRLGGRMLAAAWARSGWDTAYSPPLPLPSSHQAHPDPGPGRLPRKGPSPRQAWLAWPPQQRREPGSLVTSCFRAGRKRELGIFSNF